MKNKITAAFGEDKLEHIENITHTQIHVLDLTERTNSKHSIVIAENKQNIAMLCNPQPKDIDTLLIENPANLDITATFFKPQCFYEGEATESKNCEGIFYLSNSTDKTWILFLEIKDCGATNISRYFDHTKEQIIATVKIFRDKNIISDKKRVHANISFPRKNKTDFYSHLIKPSERKEFIDKYGIFILGTNTLTIKNSQAIA